MFTGIVQEILTVTSVQEYGECLRVRLSLPQRTVYAVSDSILLNGICSTVIDLTSNELIVEYMPTTRQRTTVDRWKKDTGINSEPPLTLQAKLSGAVVLGHVDAIAFLTRFERSGGVTKATVAFDQPFSPAVVDNGSITIDGVNLTIVERKEKWLTTHIIPFTLRSTTFVSMKEGTAVNVEFDYMAKMLWSLLQQRVASAPFLP